MLAPLINAEDTGYNLASLLAGLLDATEETEARGRLAQRDWIPVSFAQTNNP